MNRQWRLAAVPLALICAALLPALPGLAVEGGLVVKKVEPGYAAARAGLRPGDVLLEWYRHPAPPAHGEPVVGRFDSPFDLRIVEVEQAPLGQLTLVGERSDSVLRVDMPPGRFRLEVWPRLATQEMAVFQEAIGGSEISIPEKARTSLKQLADTIGAQGRHGIAAWVLLEVAAQLGEAAAERLYSDAQSQVLAAEDRALVGWFHLCRGEALQRHRQYDEAQRAFEQAVAVHQELSPESLAEAEARSALANIRAVLGDFVTAEDSARRALAIRSSVVPQSLVHAESLLDLGCTVRRQGRLDEAEEVIRSAQSICKLLAPGTVDEAVALNELGNLANDRQDPVTASELYGRAVAIFEQYAPGSNNHADTLNNLGLLALNRGDLDTAENQLHRALSVYEQFDPGSARSASTYTNLGLAAYLRGDLAGAERLLGSSLQIRQGLGIGGPRLAKSLTNLGILASARGDLVTAEDRLYRALQIHQRTGSERQAASTLANLGIFDLMRGDLEAAERQMLRALAIKQRLDPGTPAVVGCLGTLGVIALDRGDLDAAQGHFERALAIQERHAPQAQETVATIENLGQVAALRGDLETADRLFRQAFERLSQVAPHGFGMASCLNELGKLAHRRGDLHAAEQHHRQALAIREILAPGSAKEAESLHALGLICRDLGRDQPALDQLTRAIDALEAQQGRLGGSDEQRSLFRQKYLPYYQDLESLLVRRGQLEEAFFVLERARARALLAMLAERDLLFGIDVPEELDRQRRIAAAEADRVLEQLGGLPARDETEDDTEGGPAERGVGGLAQAAGERRNRREELLEKLRELRHRQAEIHNQIRAAAPRLAELTCPQPLDLAATRATLEPGTLLLSYSVAPAGSRLYVVAGDRPGVEVHQLAAGEEELTRLVRRYRQELLVPSDSDEQLRPLTTHLGEVLLQPAADAIDRATRLVIVPDGALHLLPFAALSDPLAPDRYLVEAKPLSTVVSATVLGQLRRRHQGRPSDRIVAFADPAYPETEQARGHAFRSVLPFGNQASGGSARSWFGLAPLPASRAEAEVLHRLYGTQASLWLGSEATEERAKSLPHDTAIVHFAAHGLINERFPLESALALTIPEQLETGQANGLLQAWEVFEQLRVDADLVTLSACSTALGKEISGEGIIGLVRAFQYAGARTVMASLWTVNDETTARLMQHFYDHLKQGQTKDAALRLAQLELIRKPITIDKNQQRLTFDASHPFHWAAFQLNGDWRGANP